MNILAYICRGLLATLLLALLAACGAAPAPSTPAPSPAASPSVAAASPTASASPVEEATPSAEPTPSPDAQPMPSEDATASATDTATEGVLPAPLLFLREGQIMRLERDGTTTTAITAEQPGQPDILAIIAFDVSPADGTIVYVAQGNPSNHLVRIDASGQQRTVLLANAPVNNPRWSPDGTQIALQLNDPVEGAAGLAGGVYLLAAEGGEPQLLQPNDPIEAARPAPEARFYMPHAWSPDGTYLLLSAAARGVEVCNAAVKNVESGALVVIESPEGMVSGCASGAWSVDSRTIYTQMSRPGPQPPVPGLWQADPETGAITPFVQGDGFETGGYQLVSNQRPLTDGSMYAFVATVDALPEPFSGQFPQYKLFIMGQTDALALRDEEFRVVGQALWADDNSGVIVDIPDDAGNVTTTWIPVDSSRAVVELGNFLGEAKDWARN